jgi:3-hydroxyisobutyrate dehydrogenase-like beta-hydroxyacid dehydrogenase
MGRGMAASLLRAGHEVTVYNRTRRKAETLVVEGAHLAESVADACRSEVVMTMLSDDAAAESVALGAEGIVRHLDKGALHISSSTISVGLSERLARAHEGAGQRYIAATVFGRPDVAAAGRLLVVAAGPHADVERARPLLDAIGRQTAAVSERAPAANLVKLAGNFLIASMIESIGEAMALVERGGIERQKFAGIVSSLFDGPPYRTYSSIIAAGRFDPPGFAAPLGAKDIRLALAAAGDLGLRMPVAQLLRERFSQLLEQGGEQLDWSAISRIAALDADPQPVRAAAGGSNVH